MFQTIEELRQWQAMLSRGWMPHQWYDDDGWEPDPQAPPGYALLRRARPSETSVGPPTAAAKNGDSEGFHMWVYVQTEQGLWSVGYWTPHKDWVNDSTYETKELAASRVRWLNGGN